MCAALIVFIDPFCQHLEAVFSFIFCLLFFKPAKKMKKGGQSKSHVPSKSDKSALSPPRPSDNGQERKTVNIIVLCSYNSMSLPFKGHRRQKMFSHLQTLKVCAGLTSPSERTLWVIQTFCHRWNLKTIVSNKTTKTWTKNCNQILLVSFENLKIIKFLNHKPLYNLTQKCFWIS